MDCFTTLTAAAPARVLAAGAWLKNAAARLDGSYLRWTEVHGDLGEPAHCAALEQSVTALVRLGEIDAIAHDLHPDFYSTLLAQQLACQLNVPAIAVQHHHAHIAAVQAEHGVTTPVIGLALDGVGLGTDGTAWGGELLWVHGAESRRLGHLRHLRLLGGDVAAREPWRLAAGLLHELGRGDEIVALFPDIVTAGRATLLRSMLDRDVNCPVTSSAGRWFDAAAAVMGLCLRQAHEAEAAQALEAAAHQWLRTNAIHPDPSLVPVLLDGQLDLHPLAQRLFMLAACGGPDAVGHGAALFHVNLADGLARWAVQAAQAHAVDTVALGGGCFFNRILSGYVETSLGTAGLRVLRPQKVNCGDAGLALGQAWVVAHNIAALRGIQAFAAEEIELCA